MTFRTPSILSIALATALLSIDLAVAGCGGTSAPTVAATSLPSSSTTSTSASAPDRGTTPTPDARGLPTMFPELVAQKRTAIGVGGSFTDDEGDTVALVGAAHGPGGVQIVVTHNGTKEHGDVPAGWSPSLFRTPVELGQAGEGWMISQDSGDLDQRRLYVAHDGRLVAATVTGNVPFGGGLLRDGGTAYDTWMTADGSGVFTKIGTSKANRYHVYQWEVPGPGEGGGADNPADNPAVDLVPTDLGMVCIDETATRTDYDRC